MGSSKILCHNKLAVFKVLQGSSLLLFFAAGDIFEIGPFVTLFWKKGGMLLPLSYMFHMHKYACTQNSECG